MVDVETHAGWAVDAIGSTDNHRPERFTRVRFSDAAVEELADA